ncbi:glycosyltransferase [Billgrantia sp. LNSP4103-1]|uniref:glycosyltransferase n=1 Tax=Billgrantia sp. LNSP4103-1 TaxID=3410266 RepID=UPI00403F424A
MSLSVLLSVYHNESPEFLDAALFSTYDSQTLKPNQIVLVQDGPLTPNLDAVINKWQRNLGNVLTVVPLVRNIGLGAALNEGIKHCRYDLVARMDTDDIALPERFEKQVAFMRAHPVISASSAGLEEWNEDLSRQTGQRLLPTDPERLAKFALTRSPLSHPVAIFRKSDVLAVGGYPALQKAQDYGLWSVLLSKGYKLANLPDVLLIMRTGTNFFGRRDWSYFKQEAKLLSFQRQIGFLPYHLYLRNLLLKGALRLSPAFLKRLAYRHAR